MRYLVIANASMLQPSLWKGLAASAPFFRIPLGSRNCKSGAFRLGDLTWRAPSVIIGMQAPR